MNVCKTIRVLTDRYRFFLNEIKKQNGYENRKCRRRDRNGPAQGPAPTRVARPVKPRCDPFVLPNQDRESRE